MNSWELQKPYRVVPNVYLNSETNFSTGQLLVYVPEVAVVSENPETWRTHVQER